MRQLRIPAAFMRGGTSNAIVFNAKDLPRDRALWDEIFLAAIGSPDPYGVGCRKSGLPAPRREQSERS